MLPVKVSDVTVPPISLSSVPAVMFPCPSELKTPPKATFAVGGTKVSTPSMVKE
jgi:hypothetical protein